MAEKAAHLKRAIPVLVLTAAILAASFLGDRSGTARQAGTTPASSGSAVSSSSAASSGTEKKKFIRYVEFNVSYLALKKAMDLDITSHKDGGKLSWIDLLACLAAKYGGEFSHYKSADMDDFAKKLESQPVEKVTEKMKYFPYYREAYSAVLSGLLGKYRENGEEKYGLTGYLPIAKTFPYTDCDDFGVQRTYGYSRPHLGHDMMSATGTPVIAVESGIVEALGWNQYGGWRIGIRSFDSKRYYYYAHLRQNRPYAAGLAIGKTVKAGDVIGYVGRTGYSSKENVNNIQVSHLHFGLQLIFDESEKECNNETKEYTRTSEIEIEPIEPPQQPASSK